MRVLTKRSVERFLWPLLIVVVLLSIATTLSERKAQAASPGDVVINEMLYNPNTGDQNDEFLELYNTTGSPIDITGWSFSDGIVLTFGSVTIPAHDYIIVSPSAAQTLTTYGLVTAATYTGNLSNGGETVTLVDETLAEIDTVAYDDTAPWPTSPDGGGTSLELKNPSSDNSLPASWAASLSNGGTPLAENSNFGSNIPEITNVSDPNDVAASADVDVTATVTGSGITDVTLKYKTNFDADASLAMYDDGAHNDGASGDNVYGATIPGQAVKTLVRFKVEATNAGGTAHSPSTDDSINYYGYYVKDPGATYDAISLELFVADADYADLTTNHVYDDVFVSCVIAYGNEVYDNARVRVRGTQPLGNPKVPLKVKLPSGYTMDVAGGDDIAINEFELLSNQYNDSIQSVALTWMSEQIGLPSVDVVPVVVEKNGEFHGLFVYVNKFQKEWRAAYGYDNGELYESNYQAVSGTNDLTHLQNFYADVFSLTDITTPAQKEYVLDNFNIPNAFNFMTAIGIVQGWDHFVGNNEMQYYDNATGRWSNLLWDQGYLYHHSPMLSFYGPRAPGLEECYTYCPVYNQPELRTLYFRRFRTMLDKLLVNDALKNKFIEVDGLYTNDVALDEAKWEPQNYSFAANFPLQTTLDSYENSKKVYLSLMRLPWGIPASQTDTERQQVSIGSVHADANNADEYIRIDNAADTPVDISDWTVEGIDYTIPAGSVVPANGSIYLLRDDIGYRATHAAVLVSGQYGTDLGSSGSLTLKTDENVTIDDYAY